MDKDKTLEYIDANFDKKFVEPLQEFIKIPNLTPAFDPEYFTNGLVQEAIQHIRAYADSMEIEGLKFHVHDEAGKAPMVVMIYEGEGSPNVMIYGHIDKQPRMEGWREGTGPLTPTIIGDKLYGRGSSDDGYVSFAVLLAIKNALLQGAKLPRIALVLETEEESGSHDLVPLLDELKDIIKDPDVCICLDSGALDYSTMWLTSTLRGMAAFNLKVSIAEEGVHSGLAGGIIPETFRIANTLLDRLENPETRRLPLFDVEIPEQYRKEAEDIAALQGDELYKSHKFLEGAQAINQHKLSEIYLNSNWRAALAVTGASGLPTCDKAGNVLRPSTTLRVSIRLPPGKDSGEALKQATDLLTFDPPYGATVEILSPAGGDGW